MVPCMGRSSVVALGEAVDWAVDLSVAVLVVDILAVADRQDGFKELGQLTIKE